MSRPAPFAVAMLAAALAALGVIGSDALWLVPLGRLVAHGHLPGSIPYATAPTRGWHDVAAGGQLVFYAAYRAFGGVRGIVVLQAAAAAVGFGALAAGLRRQATAGAVLLVSLAVLAGSIPTVVIAGVTLFSLALFPLLLALLESGGPLWPVVPLLALWGNLHGGVLIGLGLLGCYVVLARRRSWPVLVCGALALFLNPQLWLTPRYYEGVFRSVVARRGEGLWAPLGTKPFDIVFIVVALALVAVGIRNVRLWEAVALLGLAAETMHVARAGVWFLFVAAYPAARALVLAGARRRITATAAIAFAVAAIALLVRGPADPGSMHLAREASKAGTVLADPILGQQVAVAGGRVWVENPVDAFRSADQALYLEWLRGKGDAAVTHATLVLVDPMSKAGRRAARDPRLVLGATDGKAALYRVSRE